MLAALDGLFEWPRRMSSRVYPPLSSLWYRCYIFHGHWVSGKGFISLQCWLKLLITRLTLKQGYSHTLLGAYFPHSVLERTLDRSTLQWLRINSGLSRRLLMVEVLFKNQGSPWQIWCVKASRRSRSFYQALLLSLAILFHKFCVLFLFRYSPTRA